MYTYCMKFFRYWLPVAVWMIIIFLFSTRQRIQISDQGAINFLFFKTLHVIEYAILYVLYFRAIRFSLRRKNDVVLYAIAFILTIFYAISDEIHQTMVPSREGRLRDVIIDAIGAFLAWISINQLFPKIPRKLQHWAKRWQLL